MGGGGKARIVPTVLTRIEGTCVLHYDCIQISTRKLVKTTLNGKIRSATGKSCSDSLE